MLLKSGVCDIYVGKFRVMAQLISNDEDRRVEISDTGEFYIYLHSCESISTFVYSLLLQEVQWRCDLKYFCIQNEKLKAVQCL